jgi:hypothetical protein
LGLDITVANNAVETGLYDVWQRMSSGRLKVFRSCVNWVNEFRLYRRDDKGRVVKENDHLMDAMRYMIVSGVQRAKNPLNRMKRAFVEIMPSKNFFSRK